MVQDTFDAKTGEYLLVTQSSDDFDAKMCYLKYAHIKNETNMNSILKPLKPSPNVSIEEVFLTNKSKLVVLHVTDRLLVFSLKNEELLFEINLERKLLSSKMYPIRQTDRLLGLNVENALVLYELDGEKKNFNLVSVNGQKFESMSLVGDKLILFDRTKSNIMVIALKTNELKNIFEKEDIIFAAKLDAYKLYSQFGLSTDLKYLFFTENKRILKFYSLESESNGSVLVEIPLYNQVRSIVCSGEYVAMILQNRRVASFLINDANKQSLKIALLRYSTYIHV